MKNHICKTELKRLNEEDPDWQYRVPCLNDFSLDNDGGIKNDNFNNEDSD